MSTTTIDWRKATDAEKNACFAERVCGYVWKDAGGSGILYLRAPDSNPQGWIPGDKGRKCLHQIPDYLHSADAVLPWLTNNNNWAVEINFDPCCDTWAVTLMGRFTSNREYHSGPCETLIEAVMIALLRAKGVEVVT